MTTMRFAVFTFAMQALVTLACALAPHTALTQTANDDEEALRRMTLYRTNLIKTLPEDKKMLAERVVLRAPLGGDISKVGAKLMPDGVPVISINQGTHYAMQQVGQAFALALYSLKQDSFLLGYIRYVAHWRQFGPLPMTAVEFARQDGIVDAQQRLDALGESERGIGQGAEVLLMLFITAHELAHHVNGDVHQGVPLPADQRVREAAADTWAIQRVMALGLNPEIVVLSMEVLNELEDPLFALDVTRRHPEPLERAHHLMESATANLDTKPEFIRDFLALNPGSPSFEAYSQALRKLERLVKYQLDEYRRLATDAKALQASAKKGNIRSQLRLAKAHQDGDVSGIARNRNLARLWSEIAATNDAPYEFTDRALAAYMAGKLNADASGDNRRACVFINLAAKASLSRAVSELGRLKKDGICS